MRRRRRAAPEPALAPEVLDILVHGWGSPERQHPEGWDWVAAFLVPHNEWPALYRAHETLVEAEARRRGLARSWAAEQFEDHKGDL